MGDQPFDSKPTASLGASPPRAAFSAISTEQPGTRIAAYTLLSVLGEGGFGTVWLAEQTSPIARRVALKIIKPGMDSAIVVARFEQERQTLALMDHPNIAKVFDAGATSTGRPFFVMEYVPGEPITDYCDKRSLSVRDRLLLMARVCEAVQHAHGKGMIHRDLKPSNVLVELVDGQPMPKVIDFGIARAIQRDATERQQFTQEGMLIGTPEYMSPEQAAGMSDLDTRTDVYALGVMLYELLTGAPPFESQSLRVAALSEIQRIIRDVEPPRPSIRLSGLGPEGTTIARRRGTHVASLQRALRRELEWIPLKAMRKERERRYATAQEMAADIRRYLEGQALAAGPESRIYRARKFVGRNRIVVGASAAVLAAIVAGGVVSVHFGLSEREARLAESAAKKQAEYDAQTTKTVNTFLVERVLSSSDPDEDGAGVTVETVLDRAADALDATLGDRPEVQMRVAATLGRSFVRVGQPARGREVLMAAKALAEGKAAQAPGVADVLAEIDEYLGEALYRQADGADAVKILKDRLAALGTASNAKETLRRAALLNQLGGALKWNQPPDLDGAETAYREALSLQSSNLGAKSLDVLVSRHNLAMVELKRAQRIPADQQDARRAKLADVLALVQNVRKDTTSALGQDHPQTLAVRAEEARLLNATGKAEESERAYAETLAAMRRVLTVRHWRTLETLGNYSLVLRSLGRTEDEVRVLEEATDGYRWVRGPTSGGAQQCAIWLAAALEKTGCGQCAAQTLQRVYRDLASTPSPRPQKQKMAEAIAKVYERMGKQDFAKKWRTLADENGEQAP